MYLLISMSTTLARQDIEKKWHLIDAEGQTLGRLAVVITNLLRGRHKAIYTPFIDAGDHVVVINAEKVKVTGKKEEQMEYMFYSGYRGNEKYVTVENMRARKPEFIIEHAVEGMMPRNKLARQLMKKLRVFKGGKHDHEAQNPVPYKKLN